MTLTPKVDRFKAVIEAVVDEQFTIKITLGRIFILDYQYSPNLKIKHVLGGK